MILDVFVVIVLLFSALVAFWRGLIREVLTIFGIVGGIAASFAGGPILIPLMREWMGVEEGKEPEKFLGQIPYDMLADALAYGTVLIVFVFILSIISHFISEAVRSIGLGALDRTLGVIFGLVRGALVLGLLYLPVSYLISEKERKEYFADSKSVIYLEATAVALASYMPGEMEKALEKGAKQIEEGAQQVEETNEARKKLQEMDLLGDGQKQEGQSENKTDQDKPEGYNEEFRENMDQLIEDNLKPVQEKPDQGNP